MCLGVSAELGSSRCARVKGSFVIARQGTRNAF